MAEVLTQLVYELMPKWQGSGLTPSDWQLLEGGYSNDNYSFIRAEQKYVLRVPRAIRNHAWEASWYRGLPSHVGSKPLAFNEATGTMISPWIDGPLLVDQWSQRTSDVPGLSPIEQQQLLKYLHSLHRDLPVVDRVYGVGIHANYFDAVPEPPGGRVCCHNDLNPWNIIVAAETSWKTLDWEWAGLNDPLFDVVSLHQGLELEAGLFDLAAAYLGHADVNCEQRLRAMTRCYWQREMNWAAAQILDGNERPEIVEQQAVATEKLANIEGLL